MSELDIFNLDGDLFVTKSAESDSKDLEFYKPYPENGKDGVYKSLIRFLPNQVDPSKSKIHKYYVYLTDPVSGDKFSVDCPSTVGKKSILKDMFWKLKNSNSAADQDLAKSFSRKEDYYSLIQIVQDKNKPEMEGKIMIWKFGRKINDMLEAQLKPEYGDAVNPYDLFSGKEFGLSVRKVGEWNNYDMCQFIGEKTPIKIGGVPMEKNQGDMERIISYLKEGPQNLGSFDYHDWDNDTTDKVMNVIKNTVPDGRMVNEVIGGANVGSSVPNPIYNAPRNEPAQKMSYHEESSNTSVGATPTNNPVNTSPSTATTSSSLDDLYADL